MPVPNPSICKTERKREQNRIAQQIYRRNQKRRVLELEAAVVAQSAIICSTGQVPEGNPTLVPSHIQKEAVPLEFDADGFLVDDGTQWAVDAGALDNTECLVSHDIGTQSALHRAVGCGNLSMTKLLIDHGASLSTKDNLGNTALHLAAECGSEEIVRFLLDQKMDPNVMNIAGRTPLFPAVIAQNESIVRMIVEASADVNIRDFDGLVALYIAVERGSELIVTLLLANGADINA